MDALLIIPAGLGVGLLVGLTGVGGGSLMTPLLTAGFGMPPALAVGTDLWFAGATKGFGAALAAGARRVDWRIAGWLLAGSLPASLAMVLALAWIDPTLAARLIRVVIGVGLVLTALSLLARRRFARPAAAPPAAARRRADGGFLFACGAAVGAMTALSSIGAGAVVMALLAWRFPDRDPLELVATDLAHAVPLALVAGVGYAWRLSVDWSTLGWLLCGSLPGIAIGARLGRLLSAARLRTMLGVLLGGVGLKYLIA